ncbi:hypothetical protein STVA_11030 [Allostella vacuolata]|nr:hypothetical protein STVA_11030 [Stella vacuolata]
MKRRVWRVALTETALRDLAQIVDWTAEHFGVSQAVRYRATILAAAAALQAGPDVPGARPAREVDPDFRVLHVARGGRSGRHLLLYRAVVDHQIDILRVLHDGMDIRRHIGDP